jgi:hypothetical protein
MTIVVTLYIIGDISAFAILKGKITGQTCEPVAKLEFCDYLL